MTRFSHERDSNNGKNTSFNEEKTIVDTLSLFSIVLNNIYCYTFCFFEYRRVLSGLIQVGFAMSQVAAEECTRRDKRKAIVSRHLLHLVSRDTIPTVICTRFVCISYSPEGSDPDNLNPEPVTTS